MNAQAVSVPSARGSGFTTSGHGCARPALIAFGAIFILAGCVMLWAIGIVPRLKARAAMSWPEVPCTIVASRVDVRTVDDGSSYYPEIRYRYAFNGVEYESDRYSFFYVSAGRKGAEAIVRAYPAGQQTHCYCDPGSPDQAVLERELGLVSSLFGVLFPLVFVAMGGGVLFFGVLGSWNKRGVSTGMVSDAAAGPSSTTSMAAAHRPWGEIKPDPLEGPQRLKPTSSRIGSAIGIAIFTFIWDGVITLFIFASGLPAGKWPGLFPVLILVPLVLVGGALVLLTIHQVLAIGNPKVEIALSNGAVPLGASIDVAFQLTGQVHRLRRLRVIVEGIEKATYTRGTSTQTDESTFKTLELFSGTDPQAMAFGTASVTIPRDTMYSLDGSKNQIYWRVRVHGTIPWWPDVNESFVFHVKPQRAASPGNQI